MKKSILLLAIVAMTAGITNAQRVRIGPEIGLNLNNNIYKYDNFPLDDERGSYDINPGIRVGGILDARVARHFAIQPGIFFSRKGYRFDDKKDQFAVNINYVELPLYLHLVAASRSGANFYIGGGPYIAAALGGRIVNLDKDDDVRLRIGDKSYGDDIRGGDAGLNFDLGFQTAGSFFFRANAGVGLVNITPPTSNNFRSSNLSAGISIGFLMGHAYVPAKGKGHRRPAHQRHGREERNERW